MAIIKTNKPKTTRKSTKSAMPLKKKFRVNKWAALGVVAVLAGVGVYIVQRSSASSYTFVLGANATELQGGAVENKSGTPYRLTNGNNAISFKYMLALPGGTQSVCSHIKNIMGGNVGLIAQYGVTARSAQYGKTATKYVAKGRTANICVGVTSGAKYFNVIVGPSGSGPQQIGVSSVYGLPN